MKCEIMAFGSPKYLLHRHHFVRKVNFSDQINVMCRTHWIIWLKQIITGQEKFENHRLLIVTPKWLRNLLYMHPLVRKVTFSDNQPLNKKNDSCATNILFWRTN